MRFLELLTSIVAIVPATAAAADNGQSRQEQTPLQDQTHTVETLTDIPPLGFGTWSLDRSNVSAAVFAAIKTGYRHIDAAKIYGNQREVGQGIAQALKEQSIEREELWVTSKLWNDKHAPEDVPDALQETLNELGLDYLDLYLIHWPVAEVGNAFKIDFIETWKAMVKLPRNLVRHVGISNFSPDQLKSVLAATPDNTPYAHQFERHPYLPQQSWLDWHSKLGIHVTAYSPLGNTNPTYKTARKNEAGASVPPLLEHPLMHEIAEASGCTPAQVALSWGMSRGTSVIPRSAHANHITENWESLGCQLKKHDAARLDTKLPLRRFNNPSLAWGVRLFHGLEGAAEAFWATVETFRFELVEMVGDVSSFFNSVLRPLFGDE